jgi:hypothetical protein
MSDNSCSMKAIRLTVLIAGLFLLSFKSEAQPASFLTNGLIAYYPFNGSVNDASGNGNDGTNYGATLTTDRFGNTNAAFFFNGSNWIDIGPVVSRYDTMSLSAWINTTSLSSFSDEAAIVSKPNDPRPGTLTGSRLGTYQGAFDSGFASDETNFINIVVFGTSPANNGVWHQGVYANDGTNLQLFVDGQLIEVDTYSPQFSTSAQAMFIGKEFPTNWGLPGLRYFTGAIDDVRIYNRALSSNEVAQLYAIESSPPLSLLKAVTVQDYSLSVGSNYQVQVSSDLVNWTNQGSAFTATSSYWLSTNFVFVADFNQLYFRLVQQ